MADRHNLCTNPGCKNDATGWGTGGARATGLTGFPRTTGCRFTSGTFQETAKTGAGATTPGLSYTLSCYIKAASNAGTADLYAVWPGGGFSLIASGALTGGVVTRRSGTITAAGGATQLWLGLDGINSGANNVEVTGVLIEQAAALDTYFDGDTAGGSWDGADGNSASTLAGSTNWTADATQTITAADSAAAAAAHPADAAQAITAGDTAAARLAAAGTATSTIVCADVAAAVLAPRTPQGSWYGLVDTLREGADLARAERSGPPAACPNDGEPLLAGPDGGLYCPFDGWRPDGTYVSDRAHRFGGRQR